MMRLHIAALCAALLTASLMPSLVVAGTCDSYESDINSTPGGSLYNPSVGPGQTYTITVDSGTLDFGVEITVTDLNAVLGSSSFSVAIYPNGALYQDYADNMACFTSPTVPAGTCPDGGSGEIVITCNNSVEDCPLLIWAGTDGSIDQCTTPSPSPSPQPSPSPKASPSPKPASPMLTTTPGTSPSPSPKSAAHSVIASVSIYFTLALAMLSIFFH